VAKSSIGSYDQTDDRALRVWICPIGEDMNDRKQHTEDQRMSVGTLPYKIVGKYERDDESLDDERSVRTISFDKQ
jgi:hypothetical protein